MRWTRWGAGLVLGMMMTGTAQAASPTSAAVAGFDSYVERVEARLEQQHRTRGGFLAAADERRLQQGEMVIDQLTPAGEAELPGAMLHHWRATAFAAGARAEDFERLMRDFRDYPQRFAPQVERASVATEHGDRMQAVMRVRQRHVITVVMDTAYDVSFGRLDARHGYTASRSTRISEIAEADTAREHPLTAAEEHGFLWRQNTYWSYAERDGGLYMQVESVSLTRSIPRGLAWAVGPFVESVPRESLEFTLRSTTNALRRK